MVEVNCADCGKRIEGSLFVIGKTSFCKECYLKHNKFVNKWAREWDEKFKSAEGKG